METILSAAEQILQHSGAPALRLSRLLEELHGTLGARHLDAQGLMALLSRHPDRFRVLDPWRGPWRFVPEHGGDRQEGAGPWVVAVRDDGVGAHPGAGRMARRLRESVRWLALSVDPGSPRSVARWRGHLLEALAAQEDVRRAA